VYEQITGDIVIRVEPEFQPDHSEPASNRYVWTYTIEIENRGRGSVQLLSRHWRITDANGLTHDVRGEGVIGQQPVIEPGETFRYTSFCPLSAPSGLMIGAYDLIDSATGAPFAAAVAPFALDSPFGSKRVN
jgi:ApaG protein